MDILNPSIVDIDLANILPFPYHASLNRNMGGPHLLVKEWLSFFGDV